MGVRPPAGDVGHRRARRWPRLRPRRRLERKPRATLPGGPGELDLDRRGRQRSERAQARPNVQRPVGRPADGPGHEAPRPRAAGAAPDEPAARARRPRARGRSRERCRAASCGRSAGRPRRASCASGRAACGGPRTAARARGSGSQLVAAHGAAAPRRRARARRTSTRSRSSSSPLRKTSATVAIPLEAQHDLLALGGGGRVEAGAKPPVLGVEVDRLARSPEPGVAQRPGGGSRHLRRQPVEARLCPDGVDDCAVARLAARRLPSRHQARASPTPATVSLPGGGKVGKRRARGRRRGGGRA